MERLWQSVRGGLYCSGRNSNILVRSEGVPGYGVQAALPKGKCCFGQQNGFWSLDQGSDPAEVWTPVWQQPWLLCGQTSASGIGRTGATCQNATATVSNRTEGQAQVGAGAIGIPRCVGACYGGHGLDFKCCGWNKERWIFESVYRPLTAQQSAQKMSLSYAGGRRHPTWHSTCESVLGTRSEKWILACRRLDECSSMLTTMGTPSLWFRWKRLPFGIAPATEVFQQRLDEALIGMDGVKVIVDDILVYGEGDSVAEADADHNRRPHALLQRAND